MTLIIESCTERGVVAFAQNKIELPFGYHNSKYLMPAIESVIAGNRVERIVVGVGPGSYTGIRMGAMAAKTLSFAWGVPIQTLSTLDCFEAGPHDAVILDAAISGTNLKLPGEPPRICPLNELDLSSISGIVTPHEAKLRPKIQAVKNWYERAPSPEKMLELSKKEPLLTHDQLELLYLRKTQAELEFKKSTW